MRQKFTVESVLECPNLPGLPTVAMEVISLTREEDVNLREVASRVELDPALTAGSCEPSTVRTSGWETSGQHPTWDWLHGLQCLGLLDFGLLPGRHDSPTARPF